MRSPFGVENNSTNENIEILRNLVAPNINMHNEKENTIIPCNHHHIHTLLHIHLSHHWMDFQWLQAADRAADRFGVRELDELRGGQDYLAGRMDFR